MKGKANPFANLMSRLAPNSSSRSTGASSEHDEDSSTPHPDDHYSAEETPGDESGSEDEAGSESENGRSKKSGYTSVLDHRAALHKKRKADKPKKNSGAGCGRSETIVPKKPKNLLMMLDLQQQQRSGN